MSKVEVPHEVAKALDALKKDSFYSTEEMVEGIFYQKTPHHETVYNWISGQQSNAFTLLKALIKGHQSARQVYQVHSKSTGLKSLENFLQGEVDNLTSDQFFELNSILRVLDSEIINYERLVRYQTQKL